MKTHEARRKIRIEVFTTVKREVREGLMIRSYLNRWRLSRSWDISRKDILDIDSQQIGSVTYVAGVGQSW